MRCSRGIMVLVPLSTAFVLLISIIFFLSQGACPEGHFACGSTKICVMQRLICNGEIDCPNGEDEQPLFCADLHGGFWEVVDNLKYNEPNNSCELGGVPDGCNCTDFTVLICKSMNLTTIPQGVSPGLRKIVLTNNNINLFESSLSNYQLNTLHLGNNKIESLPGNIFRHQTYLKKLFLMDNKLKDVPPTLFAGSKNLTWLYLNGNNIKYLGVENWNLPILTWLDASRNNLTLRNESFRSLTSLKLLYLDWNVLEEITNAMFANLTQLIDLSLGWNRIQKIQFRAFEDLHNLQDLNLRNNELLFLDSNLFLHQTRLQKLELGGNLHLEVTNGFLTPLGSLKSLGLEDIEISVINGSAFSKLSQLDFIYFKKFKYCTHVPRVPKCLPVTDGMSSADNLIASGLLRWTLWVVAIFTLLTNSLVLWRRLSTPYHSSPLNIIITNLAGADVLMGVYLCLIGSHDVYYRGRYRQNASSWTSSWTCTLAGITAMVSSEVSVLILLLISAERFLLISAPLSGYNSLKPKAALASSTIIWIFSTCIAILPVLEWRHAMRFYGTNSFCFPLHIDEPYLIGWQYSAFVFLGINAIGLLGIAFFYAGVFLSIWKTRHATTLNVKDSEFAMRFLFIVMTNCCCWIPIIVLKVIAFSHIEISRDVYGWLGVFVLPVNSAVNPVLYTFTIPTYRAQSVISARSQSNQDMEMQSEEEKSSVWNKTIYFICKRPSQYTIATPRTTEEQI